MQRNDDTWTSDAIRDGKIDAIRQRVLDEPGYLASRDFVNDTPLLTAIGWDHVELVRFLLNQGANPNVAVEDGYTCLRSAVESDNAVSGEIVSLLIAAGADVREEATVGATPLHTAASRGFVEKARQLIDAGADVNRRTEIDGGETPLMNAAFTGWPKMVQFLLDRGADAAMRNGITERTPLEIARDAATGPDPEVYEMLKNEDFKVDVGEQFGDMDLTKEQMELLRKNFENLDMPEEYVKNSKSLAESGDHEEVIRILEEHQEK